MPRKNLAVLYKERTTMNLKTRFSDLWMRLGAKGDPSMVFQDLVARYQEPHRHYHNRRHLIFGLEQFDLIAVEAEHPDWVEFAFFFHDSVYDIGANDNEKLSTKLALAVLEKAKVASHVRFHVGAMIMATTHGSAPNHSDAKVMVDIDLAILGQSRGAFAGYERRVRAEYREVPEDAFWRARTGILQGFIERPRIYSTDRFHDLYEARARQNLAWTIRKHKR